MIRRSVKVQLVRLPAHHPARPSRCSRPATSASTTGSSAASTTSPPTSRSPAASSSAPRSPTAASPSAGSTDLRLSKDGVVVDAKIKRGVKIPKDTKVVVENRSAVGEQYLDFQPRSDSGPDLADGDSDPAQGHRHTPCASTRSCSTSTRPSTRSTSSDLATVVDELGTGVRRRRRRTCSACIDSGDALTRSATEALPETIKLIDDGRIVLDTQRDTSGADQDLRQELRRPVRDPQDLRRRPAARARPRRRGLQGARDPDQGQPGQPRGPAGQPDHRRPGDRPRGVDGIQQLLVTYPDVVAGGYTVVPGDGTAHFGLRAGPGPAGLHPGLRRHRSAPTRRPRATCRRSTPAPGAPRRAARGPPCAAPRTRPAPRARAPTRPFRSLSATSPYPRAWLRRWA